MVAIFALSGFKMSTFDKLTSCVSSTCVFRDFKIAPQAPCPEATQGGKKSGGASIWRVRVRYAEGLSQTGHILRYAPWVINVGWEIFWVLRVSKERHKVESENLIGAADGLLGHIYRHACSHACSSCTVAPCSCSMVRADTSGSQLARHLSLPTGITTSTDHLRT